MLYHVLIVAMPTSTVPDIADLALAYGRRSDISARSVIVTIFGDSIVPAGGRIWLGDLIDLCRPFGFSQRLVRTSMFRLAGEGWFDTERVGRRSRYALTTWARAEFAEAEARIYRRPDVEWDGRWTLVFVDDGAVTADGGQALRAALGWHGYVAITSGVLAVPRSEVEQANQLVARAGVGGPVPVATAEFDEPATIVEGGWLADALELDSGVAARYRDLLDSYRWVEHAPDPIGDGDAFMLRTMLVHDLRRARLADPDLPAELLPAGWPAPAAMELAASAYRRLSPATERWLVASTGHRAPAPDHPARGRFADDTGLSP
jgi:phenylacetic acid degradation operon negative regulatory protein